MNTTIMICVKERSSGRPSCARRGGNQLADALERELASRGLEVPVERILCFGHCKKGPVMRIAPGGAFFFGMTQEQLGEVVTAVQSAVLVSGSA
jgi:NADH:ubiquinone oxidoreductase subunit E